MDKLPDIISKLPIVFQILIALMVLSAIIWEPLPKLLIYLGRWIMTKLSPPPLRWVASSNRSDNNYPPADAAWDKSLGARWSQMREMRKNDYFRLNIRKARIIKRIQFVNPDIGYPLKYGLEISEDGIKPFQKIKEYSGVIDILLNPPIRLQELRITIVDPKLEPMDENGCTPSWSIYSIHLFQPRWFNKWGSKEVKSG